MKSTWLDVPLALLLGVSAVSFAGDPDFQTVVGRIESHFGTKRLSIPFFGLANGFVKVAHPAGARSVDLAIFEDLRGSDAEEFHQLVGQSLGPGWKPIVRVRSRRNGESVAIYARDYGRHVKFLIANREPGEAVLIQAKIDAGELARWLQDPERIGQCVGAGGDEDDKERCPDR
jgi:hypothetical protein